MTTSEEVAVRQAFKRTLSVWPGRADVDVYFDAVRDLEARAVLAGVSELVRDWHYAQRPLPGDFRRRAKESGSAGGELGAGEDGYLRGPDGRHVAMDEMATREAYRREFGYVPPGWTDEALAEREAVLAYYRAHAAKPNAERMRVLVDSLKRIKRMPGAR